MIHPDTELRFIDPDIGYGVFATRRIPRGTVTWTLCSFDRIYTPAQAAALDSGYRRLLAKYGYRNPEGQFILCWDFGRYLNHSCDASSLALGIDMEIAVRDLLPGEQMTCEYGALNLVRDLKCQCGAPNCRKVIRTDDMLRFGPEWDEKVRSTLPYSARVAQPLRPFLRDKDLFEAVSRGGVQLLPHVEHHCAEDAPPEFGAVASARKRRPAAAGRSS
jgi:hypothetical protein